MFRVLKSIYIHKRFYVLLTIIALCFFVSYWWPFLYGFCWIALTVLGVAVSLDIFMLYSRKNAVKANRTLSDKFSLGDLNPVNIRITNNYGLKIYTEIIDELPIQFQERNFLNKVFIDSSDVYLFDYVIRPIERGTYHFGNLNVYVSTQLKLVKRRFLFENNKKVMVYPSIMQMQKYDFLAMHNDLSEFGLKKIRRIGHTQEFEQIKEYVQGDDFRTVNWKATAKHRQLMVNQFQDEKSQPIYSIIDAGRVMKMPFEGLKLLDYAINASLAFSNVALKKHDKVGLILFAKKIEQFLPARSGLSFLNRILETLYNVDTEFTDSDFSLLYTRLKRHVTQRSLLLLFTNFEHPSALKRQLPYLQAIAKKHMLVVIFFENTELEKLISRPTGNLQNIYHKTIAEKFANDKVLMLKELEKFGIQAILTKPQELTINTINKYLEIKARGLL